MTKAIWVKINTVYNDDDQDNRKSSSVFANLGLE